MGWAPLVFPDVMGVLRSRDGSVVRYSMADGALVLGLVFGMCWFGMNGFTRLALVILGRIIQYSSAESGTLFVIISFDLVGVLTPPYRSYRNIQPSKK